MPFLSHILAAVLATAGLSADNLTPGPLPSETIRVVSTSHAIDFPTDVVISVEAEADSEIVEVALFYRLGDQKVKIYGYPEFTPSTNVSADFTIRTGGANYLPSGVEITYYYVMRDTEGNTFESESFSFEYKDPRYRWERFSHGDLVVLWHNRPRDDIVEVARAVNGRLQDVKQLLGLDTVKPMKAVILNSTREAGRSFPLVSETARRGHLFAGFAFAELDVFVGVGLHQNLMVHEMTHLLIDEALDSPMARIPAWLNEGLAMYFEPSTRGRDGTVSRAIRDGRQIPLRSMGSVPGRPRDVRLFYAQASSVVRYMMDSHGQERMTAVLKAINGGADIEDAVRVGYGISLEELERQWTGHLTGEPPDSPAVNSGNLASTAIIAGAVAVAIVAIVVRWFRHIGGAHNAGEGDS